MLQWCNPILLVTPSQPPPPNFNNNFFVLEKVEHVSLSHRQVAVSRPLSSLISHLFIPDLILTLFRRLNTKTESESLFLDSVTQSELVHL